MAARLRWTHGRAPKIGERRTVSRLLLFPRTIGGEARWLGVERIIQQRKAVILPGISGVPYTEQRWVDVRWAE